MPRSSTLLLLPLLAGCAHAPPAGPPLFPMQSAWRATLPSPLRPPLSADSHRVFVATTDGALTALDAESGRVLWTAADLGALPAATDGALVVRSEKGAVTSLRPRDGEVRWSVETGVAGSLPVTLDGDRLYVAGRGLVALDTESGRRLWADPHGAEITARPVATSTRVLVGDADGVLRSLDRNTGVTQWSRLTGGPLLAPPVVDETRRRLYVGTTDRRIREFSLDEGDPGWRWKVGADVQAGGLLLPNRVVFAAFDAVLWALNRGGNLAWRTPLPSRPLGPPLLVRDSILLVCRERDILGYSAATGRPRGGLRTTAEIRTPPIVTGPRLVVGLRDRSVEAYALPPAAPAAPAAPAPPADASRVEGAARAR